MDLFLNKVTPPQEEPQADPSGGIPEESIVVVGGGSSMCFIAYEDFPGGQEVEVGDSDIDGLDPVGLD